jgi:hypothetical protein
MEGQNENDELYPIAVLIDELKVGLSLLILKVGQTIKKWDELFPGSVGS